MSRGREFTELFSSIGYVFKDTELIKIALTHSSYASEHKLSYECNNERLEFIGDAFVDAVVGVELFKIMPSSHEGILSRYRADVVCERSLADAAASIDLGEYLYLGNGEDASGGRYKASILADAFEALIGAVILDGGYEAGKKVILRLLSDRIQLASMGKLSRDYKTKLQEILQDKDHGVHILYNIVDQSGPDHNKTFTVEVEVNDKILGRGSGRSKAKAEQAAAEDALSKGVF